MSWRIDSLFIERDSITTSAQSVWLRAGFPRQLTKHYLHRMYMQRKKKPKGKHEKRQEN